MSFLLTPIPVILYSVVKSFAIPSPELPKYTEAATRGVLLKKGVLKKFVIFTGKHLCWSLFLRKLQVLRPAILLKRDSNTGIFLRILLDF